MFVALAVVCDEYFVPALGVITEAVGFVCQKVRHEYSDGPIVNENVFS